MSIAITNPIGTPTAALAPQHWTYAVVPVAFGAGETSAASMLDSRVREGKQAAPPRGEDH